MDLIPVVRVQNRSSYLDPVRFDLTPPPWGDGVRSTLTAMYVHLPLSSSIILSWFEGPVQQPWVPDGDATVRGEFARSHGLCYNAATIAAGLWKSGGSPLFLLSRDLIQFAGERQG